MKPLAKSVLIPLRLTAAAAAVDADIHKKILWSGTTTLIISNDQMNDIMKIVQALEDGNNLPHELLLTTRQKTKPRNAFNNNM